MSRAFHHVFASTVLLVSSLGAQGAPSPQRLAAHALPSGSRPAIPLVAASNGDVRVFQVNADETRIVYMADKDQDELVELYAVKPDGGPSLKLSAPFAAGRAGVVDFRLSPSGKRVLYFADHERAGRYELYSCSVNGGPVVKISRPNLTATLQLNSFVMDDKRVIFLDLDAGVRGLFVAPLDGGPFVKISSSVGAMFLQGFKVTPDGKRLVFDEVSNRIHRLYSAPIDGSGPAILLNGGTIQNPFPQLFDISSDSRYVVFQQGVSPSTLHSVTVDGSELPVQLSSPGQAAFLWSLTADVTRVVYHATEGLFSAPIDGSAPAVTLTPDRVASHELAGSDQVAFVSRPDPAGNFELFGSMLSGGAPVLLSDPGENLMIDTGRGSWGPMLAVTPDGTRALFAGSHSLDQASLFSVPVAGGSGAIELAVLPAGAWIPGPSFLETESMLEFEPSGMRAVYLAASADTPLTSLFSVAVDGSSPAVELNTGAAGASMEQFALLPSRDRVLFASDHLQQDVIELFSVPLDGSQHPLQLVDL